MAQKRIKQVSMDIIGDRIRVLYDDGTRGEIPFGKSKIPIENIGAHTFIGLTLKQAKLYLGIKE